MVCGDGYSVRSTSEACDEVVAFCAIGEAGEDTAFGCVAIIRGALIENEEVGLGHREGFVMGSIDVLAVVNAGEGQR